MVHNGNVYTVDSLVERLPYSIRKCYSSNREYLLGISNNAFTLSELEVWMQRATKKYNDNYGWWK